MTPLFTPSDRDADLMLAPIGTTGERTGWRVVASGIWRTTIEPVRDPMTWKDYIAATVISVIFGAVFLFFWSATP